MRLPRIAVVLLLTLLCVFFSTSCRKASMEIPESEQELPDMILNNATYTYGQPNRKPVLMKADKITIWNDKQRTELENVSFTQESKDGSEIEMTGSCDRAVSTNNNMVTLTGNVKLYKVTDEVNIECDSLDWDDKKGEMRSDGTVLLKYQGNTEIRATGFVAKLNENVYSFERLDDGNYRTEDKTEEINEEN